MTFFGRLRSLSDRRLTARYVELSMPPAVARVINAARRYSTAWDRHDVNMQYEATFELLNAVDDLEAVYRDHLGPRGE